MHCNNGNTYKSLDFRGYSFWNSRSCWALTPERQKFLSEVILRALEVSELTREELKDICRTEGMTKSEEDCMFESWGGGIRELCERGFMNYTVREKKTFRLSPPFSPIPEDKANLEIARRYFTNIAPATIHDAQYYFHATAAQVKAWLSALPVVSDEYDGKTYFYIENGKSYDGEIPACIFLAGFDGLMLGYRKSESVFIPQKHIRGIFNLAGIIMPPILLFGKVVGRWQKKGGKLNLTFFESVSAKDKKLIREGADELWGDINKVEELQA